MLPSFIIKAGLYGQRSDRQIAAFLYFGNDHAAGIEAARSLGRRVRGEPSDSRPDRGPFGPRRRIVADVPLRQGKGVVQGLRGGPTLYAAQPAAAFAADRCCGCRAGRHAGQRRPALSGRGASGPQSQPAAHDRRTGVRRAVLELSSGEQVLLADSVRTELSERNVRIEINGDEISYTASEKSGKQAEEAYNTIRVPLGGEYSLTLGDGTRAWLNAGSSITYPLHFGSRRCVTVTGEVFFEVAPDSRHPFVVSVSGVELTVLGTSFNVMAYDDEPSVETTLVTGSLRVAAEGEETLLSPGLQAGFDKSGGGLTVRKADVEACTMWRRGLLVFYDEPLRSICRKLEPMVRGGDRHLFADVGRRALYGYDQTPCDAQYDRRPDESDQRRGLHGGRRRDPGGAEIGMTLRCVGGCPREAGNPLFQLK